MGRITDRGRGASGSQDAGTEPIPLDEIDRRIIAELTRDDRMSVTQVAENVHISRAPA